MHLECVASLIVCHESPKTPGIGPDNNVMTAPTVIHLLAYGLSIWEFGS